MNFRLFRVSLFLTTLLLLRFGFIQANGTYQAISVPVQFIQTAHTSSHDVVCLPFEISEDNEVNEARKRISAGLSAIQQAVEVCFYHEYNQILIQECLPGAPPVAPAWLLLCVFRI